MTDWDTLLKNAAKGNGFIGTTNTDEDGYFAAFADEPLPILPIRPMSIRTSGLLDLLRRRLVS